MDLQFPPLIEIINSLLRPGMSSSVMAIIPEINGGDRMKGGVQGVSM